MSGSDATGMVDTGVVCTKKVNGVKTLGIRLNFNKRYITLAPVATVIGLAFKCFDPDGLLGKTVSLGLPAHSFQEIPKGCENWLKTLSS